MLDRIKQIISNYTTEINLDSITEETIILNELGLNSIAILPMISDIEDEFEIEISDADIGDIKTIGDLIEYIKNAE